MQLTLAIQQGWLINCLKAQLVAGVGGVGHQLAQKDFLVAVEGMNHQVQELLNLCLKTQSLRRVRR